MKGFVNPIFQPVDENIEVESRRTFDNGQPLMTSVSILPQEYERIFSSFTDQSQQLNDSILQPFDNTKYQFMLDDQKKKENQTAIKPKQPVIFGKQQLNQILELIENKSPQKQKMRKTDIKQSNMSQVLKKMNNIKLKNDKQRSSTNHTARDKNPDQQSSFKNLDSIKTTFRATSQKLNSQSDEIQLLNQKINSLQCLIINQIKLKEQQDVITQAVGKIIQQNDHLKLQSHIGYLKNIFHRQIFDSSKYFILFNISKIIALALEKCSKLKMKSETYASNTPTILSRQTTSDNINEDLINEKKQFFQLIVNLKLGLPFNHPGKDLLLTDLYEKALKQSIRKANWQQFLKNEMKY